MTLKKVPFIYLRHGQTDWNVENRAMGQKDIPLNSTGIQQAVDAKKHLKNYRIDTICHSPLLRAKQTAEILNQSLQASLICIEDLKEFHLGSYEGQVKDQWFHDWRSGKITQGLESYSQFLERALKGINEALNYPNVLIVAHGGVYWAIQHYAELSLKEIPNCIPFLHEPFPLWQQVKISDSREI
jgi:broad specificity phosphatase PhoE